MALSLTLLLITGSLLMTALITRLVLGWLRHKQILDHPNERSSHSLPTPRGGGLAVTPVLLLSWGGLALAGAGPAGQLPVLAGALVLLLLSWQDDRVSLSARLRFATHIGVVAVGLLALPEGGLVFQGLLPFWLDRGMALLLWVWFLNLYNFMDGIDGITGVETTAIGLGILLLNLGGGALQGAIVTGVACGFLIWNWHQAKIFLGDSGSVPLGFLLGWLLLRGACAGDWLPALLLPGYYLADATITLLRRAARGEKVWQAHRQHFYQQAVRGGMRHDHVSLQIALTNAGLVGCACWAGWTQQLGGPLACGLVLVLGLLGLLRAQGRRGGVVV